MNDDPITWCFLPTLYFLDHDSFFDVAVIAAFPHGISPREGVGTCVGVDSPWFVQLCIHVLERGLMLEAKGNPLNVKFALGDLHLI